MEKEKLKKKSLYAKFLLLQSKKYKYHTMSVASEYQWIDQLRQIATPIKRACISKDIHLHLKAAMALISARLYVNKIYSFDKKKKKMQPNQWMNSRKKNLYINIGVCNFSRINFNSFDSILLNNLCIFFKWKVVKKISFK